MKPPYGGETTAARRPITTRVTVELETCGDGSVRYQVVADQHIYESGFRGDWRDALGRVGNVLHELSERRTLPEVRIG